MDAYEATSLVYAKIKNLEPENASKIMGFLLIQDLGEKELMRLAFGPEALLQSLIVKAKIHLGFCSSSSSSTPSSPSPLNPIARPINSNPFSHRIIPNNGFDFTKNQSPSSPSTNNSSWSLNNVISPKSSPLLSYDNIRSAPFSMPSFLQNKNGFVDSEAIDEPQVNDYLSFLNESSSSRHEDLLMDPRIQNWSQGLENGEASFHRRSYSASDVCFGSDDGGGLGIGGYKPCVYFARGFCKNGSNCKFLHGDFVDSVDASASSVGSPSKLEGLFEQREEFMRLKVAQQQQQQQRLATASEFMAGMSPSQYSKYLSFLLQQQNENHRATAAAIMIGEEYHKFGLRSERNDFLALAAEKRNSASRQIYLTFPADSTFRDEDVSEYFSKFGPVQDVRIPYQQKRMFGFVTFIYPETVKHILAKGNPHFICDSRVLVKPYKEKGKVPEKRQQHQQQQLERGDFSPCLSPSGLDTRDPYDLNLGARMMYNNTQGMMLRRKLEEQVELQQALELQGRRLMNLQLPDLKNDQLHHHPHNFPICAPLSTESNQMNQNVRMPPDFISQEVSEGHEDSQVIKSAVSTQQHFHMEENPCFIQNNNNGKGTDEGYNCELLEIHKSVEQVLPDSPFASPKKLALGHHSDFSSAKVDGCGPNTLSSSSQSNSSPTVSAGDIASL